MSLSIDLRHLKNYISNDHLMINDLPEDHPWKQDKEPFEDEWLVRVNWLKEFDEKDAKWFK